MESVSSGHQSESLDAPNGRLPDLASPNFIYSEVSSHPVHALAECCEDHAQIDGVDSSFSLFGEAHTQHITNLDD